MQNLQYYSDLWQLVGQLWTVGSALVFLVLLFGFGYNRFSRVQRKRADRAGDRGSPDRATPAPGTKP
ncbi:MAG TPA: hypothetical protein VHN20_05930 [Beijerinckiaceae bacterium]|nr:hypothetical protein [Beijerinckiaceae bacterium]